MKRRGRRRLRKGSSRVEKSSLICACKCGAGPARSHVPVVRGGSELATKSRSPPCVNRRGALEHGPPPPPPKKSSPPKNYMIVRKSDSPNAQFPIRGDGAVAFDFALRIADSYSSSASCKCPVFHQHQCRQTQSPHGFSPTAIRTHHCGVTFQPQLSLLVLISTYPRVEGGWFRKRKGS